MLGILAQVQAERVRDGDVHKGRSVASFRQQYLAQHASPLVRNSITTLRMWSVVSRYTCPVHIPIAMPKFVAVLMSVGSSASKVGQPRCGNSPEAWQTDGPIIS